MIYRTNRIDPQILRQFPPTDGQARQTVHVSQIILPTIDVKYSRIIQRHINRTAAGNGVVSIDGPTDSEEWRIIGFLIIGTTSATAGQRLVNLRWAFPGVGNFWRVYFNASLDASQTFSITALKDAESVLASFGSNRFFTVRMPEVLIKPRADMGIAMEGGLASDSFTVIWMLFESIPLFPTE